MMPGPSGAFAPFSYPTLPHLHAPKQVCAIATLTAAASARWRKVSSTRNPGFAQLRSRSRSAVKNRPPHRVNISWRAAPDSKERRRGATRPFHPGCPIIVIYRAAYRIQVGGRRTPYVPSFAGLPGRSSHRRPGAAIVMQEAATRRCDNDVIRSAPPHGYRGRMLRSATLVQLVPS